MSLRIDQKKMKNRLINWKIKVRGNLMLVVKVSKRLLKNGFFLYNEWYISLYNIFWKYLVM